MSVPLLMEVGKPELESKSDGREYIPEKQFCQCSVAKFTKYIFLGCSLCPAFLCFDHMDSRCADHTREGIVSEISISDSHIRHRRLSQYEKEARKTSKPSMT